MNDLQPGIVMSADGKSLLSRGKPLDQLEDEDIVKLANLYHADYVVLPRDDRHYMEKVHQNDQYAIFKPKIPQLAGISGDVALPEENKFLLQTANPNIEKYRKSDVQLTFVDSAGKPVAGVTYKISQTSSSFGFGASLPFFKQPSVDTKADYKPPAVNPAWNSRTSRNSSTTPSSPSAVNGRLELPGWQG